MAEKIQLSPRHYQKIESAQIDLGVKTLTAISKELLHPPCYLLRGPKEGALESVGIHCLVELLNLLPVCVQVSDCDGRMVYVNSANFEALGIAPIDPTAKPIYIWDFMCSDDEKEKLKQYLKHLVLTQPPAQTYFTRNRTPQGTEVPVSVEWRYLRDSSQTLVGFISVVSLHPSWR